MSMGEQHIHDLLRKRLLDRAGVTREDTWKGRQILPGDLEKIIDIQMDFKFLVRMTYRMIMGGFRYKLQTKQVKVKYKNLESVRKRLDLFERTGNGEHLVDIANLCMIMHRLQDHPHYHFTTVDDGHHAIEK